MTTAELITGPGSDQKLLSACGPPVLFLEFALEEVTDIEEQGDDHYRDEKLPEEQHQQREYGCRHRYYSLIHSRYDESGLFDKTDKFHGEPPFVLRLC